MSALTSSDWDYPTVGSTRRAKTLVDLLALGILVVPSLLVIRGPLNSNGSPVLLLGFLMLVLAIGHFVRSAPRATAASAGPLWLSALIGYAVVSYGHAHSRHLTDLEAAGAARGLLALIGATGVAFYAGIAIRSGRSAESVGKYLLVGGAFTSVVGLAQSLWPVRVSDVLSFPGVRYLVEPSLVERGVGTRIAGTSASPIEFAVVLGALLPLAVHVAVHGDGQRERRCAVGVLLLMLAAIPLSASRSGVVAAAVSMAVYSIALSWRQRLAGFIGLVVVALFYRAAFPGVLGTLTALFSEVSTDPSITGRTEDYDAIGQYFSERPLFGMGIGTFRPETYFFVDNQWLVTLVEGGVVGLALLASLVGATIVHSRRIAVSENGRDVSLAVALLGGVLALAVSGLTFDLFGFLQASILFFLLVGMIFGLSSACEVPALPKLPSRGSSGVDSAVEAARSSSAAAAGQPVGRHRAASSERERPTGVSGDGWRERGRGRHLPGERAPGKSAESPGR